MTEELFPKIAFIVYFTGNALCALVFRFKKNPDIPKANFHAILCVLIWLSLKP